MSPEIRRAALGVRTARLVWNVLLMSGPGPGPWVVGRNAEIVGQPHGA